MKCPRCSGENLNVEKYEGVEIDKCPKCKGVWFDDKELLQIVKTKDDFFTDQQIEETLKEAFKGVPDAEINHDVACPKCSSAMKPVNYDYRSGIIIDRCASHGFWLDGPEVEKVQAHAEYWAKQAELHKGEWTKLVGDAGNLTRSEMAVERSTLTKPIYYVIEKMFGFC